MVSLIPKNNKYTYEDFLEITKDIKCVEYINSQIYYMPQSPNTEYQKISFNLVRSLVAILKVKYDVIFEGEKQTIQPNLTIICDKSKITPNNYKGIPTAIIEILSSATAEKHTIEKMNLYMRFGVSEYWIVKPKSRVVEIYTLEERIYTKPTVYSKDDVVKSSIYSDLSINLKAIFTK